ncbi:MAG: patatin-like phospholipase family protein, partial [Acidimicrobiales bacterium]
MGSEPCRDQPRLAVVLGGGWVLGGSFHAGILLALEHSWGIDPRTVDTIIGTSSGAVAAGLVAGGLSAEDLYARETGDRLSDDGERLMDRTHRQEPVSDRTAMISVFPADLVVGLRAIVARRPVAAGAILAGLLPRGGRSHDRLRHYFDDLHQWTWPDRPHLQLCAVDLQTGRRVVIDHTSSASSGLAIAASCAVPGIHRPVRIDGRELIDGALHSVDNADATGGADTVILSSPMSCDRRLGWSAPLATVRNGIRAGSHRELRDVGRTGRLIAVRPTMDDIEAMGP